MLLTCAAKRSEGRQIRTVLTPKHSIRTVTPTSRTTSGKRRRTVPCSDCGDQQTLAEGRQRVKRKLLRNVDATSTPISSGN
jgi:hypothetical protein